MSAAAIALAATGLAGVPSAQAAAAIPPPTGWTQTFMDEFDGSSLNGANWQVSEGTSYPGGPSNFGTGEVEVSSRNNVTVANGVMSITAKGAGMGPWTAARIETNRTDFQPPAGGKVRFEASLRLPEATNGRSNGYWPAFWILGAPYRGNWWNWPMIGEFDIMENVSGLNRVWQTMHCGTAPGGPCNEKDGVGNGGPGGCAPTACTKGFHKYTLDWSRADNSATWYMDGKQVHRTQRGVNIPADVWDTATNHGFYVILNIAMGGEMPVNMGVPLNGETGGGGHYDAEYVGVWTGPANAPPPTGNTPPPANTGTPLKALGKCLELRGASNADGTPVQTSDCVTGSQTQKWSRSGDTVRSYGKCLDIANSGTANGSQVILWPCHGGQGQVFQYRTADSSLYNPRSGKCLEIPNSNTANGTRVIIWTCDAKPKQVWTFS